MAATLVKSVMLKITSDDGDTETKLERISKKADELAAKHPELKVRIDAGAATAKMAVLRKELKDTGAQSVSARDRLGALGGALNTLTLGLSSGWGEMTMFQKAMAGLNIATGVGEPLLAGLTVTVGGLAAGLAAAGAGMGVFGLVAKGVFSQLQSNITAVAAAQAKIDSGDTGKALAKDYKAIGAALHGLTGPQKALVTTTVEAQRQWHQFTTSATAGLNTVLLPAIRLLPQALALIKPFLAPVEQALQGLVHQAGLAMGSSGLKSFVAMLASNSGDIYQFADAAKNVAKGIGGIIKSFMPFSGTMLMGLDKITAKFATWGQTLTSHSGFKALVSMAQQDAPLVIGVLKNLAGILKTVGGEMTGMSSFGNSKMFLQAALAVSQLVNSLLKAHPELVWLVLYLKMGADGFGKLKTAAAGISGAFGGLKTGATAASNLRKGLKDSEAAASGATGVWGSFGGNISKAVTAIKGWGVWSKIASGATKIWTGIQWLFDAAMDANPISIIIIAIGLLVAAIVICTIKFQSFRNFWKALWRDAKQWTVDAGHGIETAFKAVVRAGDALWHGIDSVIHSIERGWDRLVSGVQSMVSRVGSFFRSLPGKIVGWLGDLGGMLFRAGVKAIQGLINGLGSMVSTAISKAASWGHDILSALGSPFGIHFSEPTISTKMIKMAQQIGRGLMTGLDGMKGSVTAGAGRIGAAISQAISDGLVSKKAGNALKSALMAQMQAARAYSQQITSSAVSGYDVTQLTNQSGNAVTTAKGVQSALHLDVTGIMKFYRDMRKLGREGLSRTLLQQLFAAGPVSGGKVAAALAAANLGEIRTITHEENRIQAWSDKLGAAGAQSVYGGQAGAARVFLTVDAGKSHGLDQLFRTWLKASIRAHGGNPDVIGA